MRSHGPGPDGDMGAQALKAPDVDCAVINTCCSVRDPNSTSTAVITDCGAAA
ncbi:hypothetical protein ACGFW5_26160 [Streptomyces sp. NPDC048416]|uniref:hypothetical protein n=1 Tax=Streptomyces sp. NPDC048416 TaxID=3365546 RepID=UPI00372014A2